MLNKCDGGGAVNMCSYILQNGSAYTRNGVGGCDLVGFACEPGKTFKSVAQEHVKMHTFCNTDAQEHKKKNIHSITRMPRST